MASEYNYHYSYSELLDQSRNVYETNYLANGKLEVKSYENCYALPYLSTINANGEHCDGGGLFCNGHFINNSGLNIHGGTPYNFEEANAQYINDIVLFAGYMSSIWGHAITDCMKHLWWFSTEEYKTKYSTCSIIYWGERPVSGNFKEILRLAGIPVEKLKFVDKLTCYKRVLVPDSCFESRYPTGTKVYPEYAKMIDHMILACANYKCVTYDKLFIARKPTKRDWCGGSIEKCAIKAGYHVIYPEQHTLEEQIVLYNNAKELLSYECSSSHNAIFCKPSTKLYLMRKANYANIHQAAINQVRNLNVTVIDNHLSVMNNERFPYGGPFFNYVNASLCEALNVINNYRFPLAHFKKYVGYSFYASQYELEKSLEIPAVYSNVIAREISVYKQKIEDKYSFILKLPIIPNFLLIKIYMKLSKHKVRSLL